MDTSNTQNARRRLRDPLGGVIRWSQGVCNKPRPPGLAVLGRLTSSTVSLHSCSSAAGRPRPRSSASGRYRLAVASRSLAAIVGGYACAAAFAVALAAALPLSRSEAVLWGTMLSFLIWSLAAIWAFTARSASRAWLGILLPAAVFGAVVLFAPGPT